MMAAGFHVIYPGPGVDALCNALYVADHPGTTYSDPEARTNPLRMAFLGDDRANDASRVYAENAAWMWTCGPRSGRAYVTWAQINWDCQRLHLAKTHVQSHLRDPNNAYSWDCVSSG
jgi:hypothetical protein